MYNLDRTPKNVVAPFLNHHSSRCIMLYVLFFKLLILLKVTIMVWQNVVP